MDPPLRRMRFLFALLYFAEGVPIGFIWWALPTMLRERGVETADITGLTSMVVLPWALKFAWAPLVDTLTSERVPLRAFVAGAQGLMGATLLPLAFLDPVESLELVTWLLVAHAAAAATQDVAVDALCIATVPAEERGRINGWMQAGMLLARAIFGGGVLLVSSWVGREVVVGAMVLVIWSIALAALRGAPRTGGPRHATLRDFAVMVGRALRSGRTWAGLGFALVGEATFKGAGSVVGPYLIDLDVSEASVGLFFSTGSVVSMVAGAIVGGRLADQLGRRAAVVVGQLAVALAACLLTLGPVQGHATVPVWASLALLYLGAGVFTTASFALLMDITDPGLGATQFSAYMGMVNLCEAWSARLVGTLTTRAGYGTSLPVAAGLGLVALPLLLALDPKRDPDLPRPLGPT